MRVSSEILLAICDMRKLIACAFAENSCFVVAPLFAGPVHHSIVSWQILQVLVSQQHDAVNWMEVSARCAKGADGHQQGGDLT